jgi:hypothetical protein
MPIIILIDSISNHKYWDLLYSQLEPDKKNTFFSPEYYECYRKVDSAETECFIAQKNDDNFLFYPYLIKNINELGYDLNNQYFDIQGAYGYNGPIGKVNDAGFLQQFNQALKQHFLERNVVTEFVRYCPVVGNRIFHTYPLQIDVLDNVYIDLSTGLEYVWNNSFEGKVRRAIKKGISYGLETRICTGDEIEQTIMDALYQIYIATMQRNQADNFYFFNINFFEAMLSTQKKKIIIAVTYLDEIPVTAELLMVDGQLAYGFLGGTLSEYYMYKANTFQRYELIKYLIDKGFSKYSIGGGAIRNDSIYDFKMSFAKGCQNPFYIGTYVHNSCIHKDITSQWENKYPALVQPHKSKVQCYRIKD